jgi:carbon monoxide dehydrogenase subunit G
MSVWFEGSNEIECNIQQVKQALENHGELYVGVISLMPGLTSVELVEQGSDFVTIKTNEGLMKRTNISKRIEAESVVVEFDEEY